MKQSKTMLTKTWAVAVLACVCCLLWGSAIPVIKTGYRLILYYELIVLLKYNIIEIREQVFLLILYRFQRAYLVTYYTVSFDESTSV